MSGTRERFVRDFHAHFTRDPNACLTLGVARLAGELPDPTLTERDARVDEARALIRRAEALERDALSFDDRLDLELAVLKLSSEVHRETVRFNGRRTAEQKPEAGDAIGEGIFLLFINDPRPDGERLADVTSRVLGIPAYLDALLHRLDEPVARWVDMEVEKVRGLPQLFEMVRSWAEEVRFADRAALGKACVEAERALEAYTGALGRLPTTTRFHLATEDAREIVRLRGIEPTLETLHGWAREFLAENRDTIESLRARLSRKYALPSETTVEELQAFLAERFRVDTQPGELDGVLRRYEAERERILSFVSERDLFPVFADQEMKILRTPPFMEPSIPAGAMLSPAPFREGTRTSLVYLTLREELLDEHTELGIPSMMIHEGIPGHHLQLATASMHPSVIRRHVDAMEHAEGWTTMLEDYMLDQGYMGELTDEARFVGKREINRIGARVAIDLFFMTGEKDFLDVGVDCDLSPDDPFLAAGNLLQAATGFVPARTQAELNWYSQERGYPLCYLTGNRLVWGLQREIGPEREHEFHRLYLESGNMPVSFLRRVLAERGLV